jgi:hypothetical protein
MTGIGITGHRQLPDIHLAASQVDAVLGKIRSRFNAPYTLYSSLAEGADRLAARRALEILDARLVVPLPFKKEDLLESCTQDSRLALLELLALAQQVIEMPSTPTLEEAYQSAGHFILDRVDVLIALWDGRPARGLGGTGQVVAEARARGLPLAWIHARNHIPGDGIPSFLGPAAGNVTFENFPRLGRKTG